MSHDAEAAVPPLPGEGGQAPERLAGRNNLLQLIQMRWLAVAGQLATILVVQFALGVQLPLVEMLTLLGVLTLFNVASRMRSRLALPVGDAELFFGLLADVAVLTGQLYFSGGIGNPFIYLYLLQVAVASVLLKPSHAWAVVGATSLCFTALTNWHRPLPLPDMAGPVPSTSYTGGLLICFVLTASLLVIFIGRIGRNLRQRDTRLADLRQRAAEEEHIVRMGLLASGAAHELGTPLATLSVILGDWAHMAPFAAEPELREEIEEMQVQLQRCKAIVSGILLSAGEARGEAPVETTLHAFLDELVQQWRGTRPVKALEYHRDGVPDVPIISDAALRQMVNNVLDNALEAGPVGLVRLVADSDDDTLVLRVQDEGPGFAPEMLERFGKPYQSSKGRPGGGLGLFLSVNVARTLGGRIEARNRPGGGAEVVITLPLASLMPPEWSPESPGPARGAIPPGAAVRRP
jgi:two-component system sensor histidine kinase RegB